MKYATPSAFRNALEERLRQQSASHGISLMRLRKLVAFDRLLARLLIVAPHRWVVKGGVALDYRFGEQARTTRDLDLARHDDADATTRDLIASQHVDVGDYFAFSIERATAPDLVLEDGAIRYRAQVELDGRRFEGIVIDVGFGDPFPLTPDYLRGHDLLTFAGIQPIAVPLLPLERHLAENSMPTHARTAVVAAAPASRISSISS